jgi:hypothetical protein
LKRPYRFKNLQLGEKHGSWTPLRHPLTLEDPGWQVHSSSASAFSASDG